MVATSDDRVGDRRHRHDHEAALGEQDRGGHRPDRVQQHLRDEEAQEERRQRHLLRLDRGRWGRRWRGAGRWAAAKMTPTTETTTISTSAMPSTPEASRSASRSSPARKQVDERGHQHRRERTGGDELEEDVRDRARGLVGVPQVGGAEHGGDHPDLDESRPRGRRSVATLIRAAARVGRSRSPPPAGKPTGARAFSGGDRACWRPAAHPAAVGPAGGTGRPAAGGRSSCRSLAGARSRRSVAPATSASATPP